MRLSVLFAFLSLVAGIFEHGVHGSESENSNVVVLTPDNFDQIIGKDKFALVEFYAPWCGHCKNLAPVFEQLADTFVHSKNRVVIAKVDADEHRELGTRFEVQGFPTLKWFGKDSLTPEDYNGGRDLKSLSDFVEEKSGVKPKVKKEIVAVTVLTTQTFDEIALDPEKNVLVEFYAPWCGHCKNLAPTFEKVAKDYAQESDCVVANLDATEHRPIGDRYDVKGYPTLKFFPKGENKTPVDYTGGRTEQDFVDFLNEKCGKQRLVGGRLSDSAGKIPELDALAVKFTAATTRADKEEVIKEAKSVADKLDTRFSLYYSKIMEKTLEKENYVDNEIARLNKIIESGTISDNKIDDFTIRKNILLSFHKDFVLTHQEL